MQIHELVTAGHLSDLKATLAVGADTEAYDDDGYTALMVAVTQKPCSLAVISTLLDVGADVHALSDRREVIQFDPEVIELIRESGEDLSFLETANELDTRETVLGLAAAHATADVVCQILQAGADPCQLNPPGYSPLLKAVYRERGDLSAHLERPQIMQLLLDVGADIAASSKYGECPMTVASQHADVETLKLLLSRGGQLTALMWNELYPTITYGSLSDVQRLIEAGESLENEDFHERTPLLFAIRCGNLAAVKLLAQSTSVPAASARGETPMGLALESGNAALVSWLLNEKHWDFSTPVESAGNSALRFAVQYSEVDCVSKLIAAGCDIHDEDDSGFGLLHDAENPEVVNVLCKAGLSLDELPASSRAEFLGYDPTLPLAVSRTDYESGTPEFGNANPQEMNVVYWQQMIRTRQNAWAGAQDFREDSLNQAPAWSADRFGQSMTRIPDGRFVEIGGEHEDYYDPDFYIYNDVIVHDGAGSCRVFCYPRNVFPPTDFHSATAVGSFIYVIGCLGYPDDRCVGRTPVYRLNCDTFEIQSIETKRGPGWIHRHRATVAGNRILLSGGMIWNGENLVNVHDEWSLDLSSHTWEKLSKDQGAIRIS